MAYRRALDCLWCGTPWTTRGGDDLEGWAQLCPTCLGKAGSNPFLRDRLRQGLAARAAVAAARRAAFEGGAIHDAAWNAELDVVTRWLDEVVPSGGRIAEPAAGVGFFSPLL